MKTMIFNICKFKKMEDFILEKTAVNSHFQGNINISKVPM